MAKLLLEKGAGLELKEEYLGQAPLSSAGCEVVVKVLLEKRVDVKSKTTKGCHWQPGTGVRR